CQAVLVSADDGFDALVAAVGEAAGPRLVLTGVGTDLLTDIIERPLSARAGGPNGTQIDSTCRTAGSQYGIGSRAGESAANRVEIAGNRNIAIGAEVAVGGEVHFPRRASQSIRPQIDRPCGRAEDGSRCGGSKIAIGRGD